MNIFEKLAIGMSALGILAVTQINADETHMTLAATIPVDNGADVDPQPWVQAVDSQLTQLDTVRDADTIEVLKQFKRTIDPNKHGKIYGDNLRVALFKMKNTLPALYDQLMAARNQQDVNRLIY